MARQKKPTVTQRIMSKVVDAQRERTHDLSRAQYIRDTKRFVKFCREKYDSRTFEECREHIQAYSDYLQNKGYTASTTHTYLAAVCSSFDVDLATINKPTRHVADYVRGRVIRNDSTSCDLNDPRWSYLVDFQRAVGIRRDELFHLQGSDIVVDESGHTCVFVRRGKGGKPQHQRINEGYEDFVCAYFNRVSDEQWVFDRSLFDNDLNFHSLRAESAREYYYCQLNKINNDPTYAKRLEAEIRARWRKCNLNKNGKVRRLPDNEIYGYYTLRGMNRELAIKKGYPLSYNKLALLATSVFKLSHWRNDVTIASYFLY